MIKLAFKTPYPNTPEAVAQISELLYIAHSKGIEIDSDIQFDADVPGDILQLEFDGHPVIGHLPSIIQAVGMAALMGAL